MKLEDYEFEKKLGEGSYSEVWLTSKNDSPKKYATKKMERDLIEKSELTKYLTNEITILKYLNNPNIIGRNVILNRPAWHCRSDPAETRVSRLENPINSYP